MSRGISKNLRYLVASRAGYICEYCHIKEDESFFSLEIDHIISLKHQGSTTSDNLAFSCYPCNNNKGSDIGTVLLPERDFIRLFNPREDVWSEHFETDNGVIYGKTKVAEATIKILKLNVVERIIERRVIFGIDD